jgi:hypothetical protein
MKVAEVQHSINSEALQRSFLSNQREGRQRLSTHEECQLGTPLLADLADSSDDGISSTEDLPEPEYRKKAESLLSNIGGLISFQCWNKTDTLFPLSRSTLECTSEATRKDYVGYVVPRNTHQSMVVAVEADAHWMFGIAVGGGVAVNFGP